MTGAAIALWVVAASGAEVTRLVKARVVVGYGLASFRHEVSISSRDESRSVVSVLLWHRPGLPERPEHLTAPEGWEVHARPRQGPGGATWAVEFECPAARPEAASRALRAESAEAVPCGIRAGQTVKFHVVLPYPSDSLAGQPVLVGFSDGQVGIAS